MRGEPQDQALHLERRVVRRYVAGVVGVGIPIMAIPAVFGTEGAPFILVLVYVVLLGGALLTARRSGPGGVRRLFSGVLHWRIGWRNWVMVVGAVPMATIAIAVATRTYTSPPDGWLSLLGDYLFLTFVFGALVVNIFEETAWQGLVQRNLARRHGLVKAAGLTSIPFVAVHLPLGFVGDATVRDALVATVFLIVFAPAMRYVMGRTDHATGGSLLAVGVLHASFNASGQLGVVDGEWQYAAGLAVVAGTLLVADLLRARPAQDRSYSGPVTTGPSKGVGVSPPR